ncbi:hypothetical protein GOB13_15220 [Sinorhizobium meliloti]|uniref:hypothetical protein n=1 Tax=Rhizobium meliloti TaxID=382 RepID=UPI00129515ED|nr:hypothetical protein [Sinorhizobium meliloti]MDX0009028.1 hypothetical protein [Sinorhizobium meliloti]MDX0064719.1 hypothetical protein [Sinorhizobium meliloti]MDX0082668.1 hypothetical protein [Sinorhizobium meliloti]MDX0226507.1 hypothetical protein [Sinorhizobium meliloti]MQU68949.1 hypothetical protein [Sinorhizobium meliloti]
MASVIPKLHELLRDWALKAVEGYDAAGVYLFGSLIYRDGAQFGESSDVDLVVTLPKLDNALERYRWLDAFVGHKSHLEIELMKLLNRKGDVPISSIVAITDEEITADVHKDGHREFFSANTFQDLTSGKFAVGLPSAGKSRPNRFLAAALSFSQKTRNQHFAISPNNTLKLHAYDGDDPLPKPIMRAAAMAARNQVEHAEVGVEHDVQEGLDAIFNELYLRRRGLPQWRHLYEVVSVRRKARGEWRPIQPSDQLLLGELIFDMAFGRSNGTSGGAGGSGDNDQGGPKPSRKADEVKVDEPVVITTHTTVGAKPPVPALPPLPRNSASAFFHERFAKAFPGIRRPTWFEDPAEIRLRLSSLLQEPLVFSNSIPIWWWRNGNIQIESFRIIEDDLCLMNYEELRVRRIAAMPGPSYKWNFVYVEAAAMEPTGLYNQSSESIEEEVSRMGYAVEEYGLLDDGTLLTRPEYDDGAKKIGDEIIDTTGRSELRVRYVSPYNFVIAAHDSPINNPRFDEHLASMLNKALNAGEPYPIVEKLSAMIAKLPLRTR